MIRKLVVFVVLATFVATGFAAESKKNKDSKKAKEQLEAKIELPAKGTSEYWVVRSQAMTELIPFLTKKRSEFNEHLEMLGQFLDEINKGEDFLNSGITAPDTPETYAKALDIAEKINKNIQLPDKPMTWEEVAELAMEHIMYEGYMPTDVQGPEELEMLKKICGQKERYGQKVRKDLRQVVKKCMNIWTYLGTIEQQEAARVYAYREKERKQKEYDEKLQALKAQRTSLAVQRREQQKHNQWLIRQDSLSNRYNRYRW
jgi:type III secretory pathway component EscV